MIYPLAKECGDSWKEELTLELNGIAWHVSTIGVNLVMPTVSDSDDTSGPSSWLAGCETPLL
jgi:hypothetical protein